MNLYGQYLGFPAPQDYYIIVCVLQGIVNISYFLLVKTK